MNEVRDVPQGVNGGKPQAPVEVTGRIGTASAEITVLFTAPATGVDIRFAGTEGLQVLSGAEAAVGQTYAAGSKATFAVTFKPGEGRSVLTSFISGQFRGRPQSRAVAFPVGELSENQKPRAASQPQGQPAVHVMPAQPR